MYNSKLRSLFFLFSIILLLTLSSSECADSIRFKNPQPENTKNRSGFGREIQGVYISEKRDFAGLEFSSLKEFTDTLSAILDIHINIVDSTTLTISEKHIIRKEKEDLVLGKEFFGDYLDKILRIERLRFLKSVTSTRFFYGDSETDTVYFRNNVMFYIDKSDTTEIHVMKNALYAIANHDTVVNIDFSKDQMDAFIVYDSSQLMIHITDSSILVFRDDLTVEASFRDTALFVYKGDDTLALASYTDNALHLYSNAILTYVMSLYLFRGNMPDIDAEYDTLILPVYDGDIHINFTNKVDTMFRLSDKTILRKYKNSYYLNTFRGTGDSCYWHVSQLSLNNGVLSHSKICPSDALVKLYEITEVTEIKQKSNSVYIVDPSKREFRKFIKSDGFSEHTYFKKSK